MLELTLYGDVPSKKNSKRIFKAKNGRTIVASSSAYMQWQQEQSTFLNFKHYAKVEEVSCIQITIYPRTKRKADLTNKAESIMDLLVEKEIINEDNWYEVPKVILVFGGVDKAQPRAEVIIWPKEN